MVVGPGRGDRGPHPRRGGTRVEEGGAAAGGAVNIPAAIGKVLKGTHPESINPRAARVITVAFPAGNQVDGIAFVESTFRGIINDNTDRLTDLQRAFGEPTAGPREIAAGAASRWRRVEAVRTLLRKIT